MGHHARMPGSQRFSREGTDYKKITTLVVVGGVILAGIAGVAAFALSFRPSRFSLAAGHVLVYRLKSTTTELASDGREGRPATDERTIALVGIGSGSPGGSENQVALLAEEVRGRDRLSLHAIEADGVTTLLDAAARPVAGSRTVGIFDLNLFALPPSASEQSWDVQLAYGLLPPAKQQIQARAKRSKSSSNPEFQLKLPTSLEWLENNTYRQLRDLVCTYRYRSSQHAVDQATLRCIFASEQADGSIRRFRVLLEIDLIDSAALDEDPQRLRSVALACAAATAALSDPAIGPQRRAALADDLRTAETAVGRLRQLADRLAVEVRRQPAANSAIVAHAAPPRLLIQVAIGPEAHKVEAEQLARTLIAGGFTARVEPASAGNLRVVVGPLIEKDPTVLDRLQRSFPYLKPLWIEAPAP